MNTEKESLVYKNTSIRIHPDNGLVSITDLWKAEGSSAGRRPDKWRNLVETQEFLESLSKGIQDSVERNKDGKIITVYGLLETVSGGDRRLQGTFANPPIALAYARSLSEKCYQWMSSMFTERRTEPQSTFSASLTFPTAFEDFNGKVRSTPDGRFSIYDAIAYTTGHKNPYQVWNDLCERLPVFLHKTEEYKFPGRGGEARPTPVADLQVFMEILVVLPGKLASQVREEAVRTLIRFMKGDPSLIDEILERIHEPSDLVEIEAKIRDRRILAYGLPNPLGCTDNPLTEITSEIKKGYGWAKNVKVMEDLLVELATYRGGMVIQRQSPHRAFSENTKKAKTRRIDLVLQSISNLDVLHIYQFQADYVDDKDVADVFIARAYPEIAYRDFSNKGIKRVVAHLVSPGGITQDGVIRLKEVQKTLREKYGNKIELESMSLKELVWGEIYHEIEKLYADVDGRYGRHYLHKVIRPLCERLCDSKSLTPKENALKEAAESPRLQQSLESPLQLSFW